MARKIKSHYKQQARVGDKVINIYTREIGTIKQIDNRCNLRDNDRGVNEYYIKWGRGGHWSRHDCYYFDHGILDPGNKDNPPQERIEVVHLTKAAKVLYGKKET